MPTVDVGDETLHFIENGSGPAMILLHGIGANAEQWLDVIGALGGGYAVRAFDLHGHGGSSCNQGLSISAMTTDLLQAIKILRLEPFHLVGVSLGGAVAMHIAAAAPKNVKSLIVSDVGLDIGKVLADEIYGIREAVHYLQPDDFAEQISQALLSADALPERAQALAASIRTLTKQRYLQALEAFAAADLRPVAANVKASALVLHGEFDDLITTESADALARAVGGARRAELPNAGHLANLDNPIAFATAVGNFIGS